MKEIAFIVCGALAREVLEIKQKYGWEADILGVPSLLHNNPENITPAVLQRIQQAKKEYKRIIVVYGDCGTSGELDSLLEREGVKRVSGPHCYEMYANGKFEELMDGTPGTFFFTDYLVRSFDHLVLEGLGIDKHPQLRDDYFKNYSQIVYLAQHDDPDLRERARWAADQLDLPLEIKQTGYGLLEKRLVELVEL
jgi:hypothetical protein